MAHLFGTELFIWFIVHAFCDRLSVSVCASVAFGFVVGVWDLIV